LPSFEVFFRMVVLAYSLLDAATGLVCWFFCPFSPHFSFIAISETEFPLTTSEGLSIFLDNVV
jgi:hypothetical protein